eukprot:Blabericola_migrator_1__2511@NODE_1706_length_3964_cov_80_028227_g1103_i0_p2_GENE_NODE_1706_length_3964_cov_80_028227_g1103_i0NODE_1706_length_3964_cov_80_028227_g1103_i0_p2_ORF_typecomplete_len237_score26_09C2/PF00168_30/1_2e02C2/PF00168_30/1_8e14_NODE_1706_length_3964_cov_80_028227_g1103_i031873897
MMRLIVMHGEAAGATPLVRYVDNMQLRSSFDFPIKPEQIVEIYVCNSKNAVYAQAGLSLDAVIKERVIFESADLYPAGRIDLTLRTKEDPLPAPKYLTVRVHEARDLGGGDSNGSLDPYCIVKLDGEPLGTTRAIRNGGPNVRWQNEYFTAPYEGQGALQLEVWNAHTTREGEPVGEVTFDLLNQLRMTPKPKIHGWTEVFRKVDKMIILNGSVRISVVFWNNPADARRALLRMVT